MLKYSALLKNIKVIEETDLNNLTEKLRLELLMNILRGAVETGVNLDDYYDTFKKWQEEDGEVILYRRHKNLSLDETTAVIMFYFAEERFHEGLCTELLFDGTMLKLVQQIKNFIY